jgi:hypothetical protein
LQPPVSVVDDGGEAVVEEVRGEHRCIGRAKCKLLKRIFARFFVRPERAAHNEPVQPVGFDVDSTLEAPRKDSRDGGRTRPRNAGHEEDAGRRQRSRQSRL